MQLVIKFLCICDFAYVWNITNTTKNWQLPLGQLYSGRDKSDCPLPCTIAATVVRSSLVHGSNETVGFELGFYPDVEVEKLYKVALILVPLHFQ